MNRLVALKTHSEPTDYRGPFEPVSAAIRQTGHSTPCHRCDHLTIPDLVHLADAEGAPLCPNCTRLVNPALRRGLLALNQLFHALHRPDAHPAVLLVNNWRSALELARPEEADLLTDAAQLLAAHIGYRPPGFRPSEITA
ncbi:hypothetical protein [Streptomyces sp. NPDC004008]